MPLTRREINIILIIPVLYLFIIKERQIGRAIASLLCENAVEAAE
jgi:hypothetical protein